MELSDRLQEALDKKSWNQADLCRVTHLSSAVISQIVSGTTKNPTISTLVPIALALEVSLDYLVFGEKFNKPAE